MIALSKNMAFSWDRSGKVYGNEITFTITFFFYFFQLLLLYFTFFYIKNYHKGLIR